MTLRTGQMTDPRSDDAFRPVEVIAPARCDVCGREAHKLWANARNVTMICDDCIVAGRRPK